jgi:expansin (peptidoglycan-binding protein)
VVDADGVVDRPRSSFHNVRYVSCLSLRIVVVVAAAAAVSACGASTPGSGGDTAPTNHISTGLGESHSGIYNLGPVAFSGSYWNSCAPYTPDLEKTAGDMLAGLALAFNGDGSLCDACITMKSAQGKSIIARVITTGETHGVNDVDLSQSAFDAISSGEDPRSMSWALVKCPSSTAKLQYQFQTEANPDWTSLWIRNPRLPLESVEVKSANHASFFALTRGTDGTLTDDQGFGDGSFTIKVTAQDGQVITDTFNSFTPGGVLSSTSQFQ